MIENGWSRGEYDSDLPDIPDPVCPICGHECPETIFLQDGVVVGCEHCVDAKDAEDWAADEWERQMEAEREHQEELNRYDD